MERFQPEIQYFAETFVILQDARHRADYALEGRYYKLDILANIDQDDLGFPLVHFIAKSDIGRRDPATV